MFSSKSSSSVVYEGDVVEGAGALCGRGHRDAARAWVIAV